MGLRLKQFFQWYKEKLRKSPFPLIVGSLIALFAALGTINSGVQAVSAFWRFTYPRIYSNGVEYRKLAQINTGLNISYIDSFLGKPSIVKKLDMDSLDEEELEYSNQTEELTGPSLESYIERIYVDNSYFLQIIIDREGTIASFAVTTRKKYFNPEIPIPCLPSLRLGSAKLIKMDGGIDGINITNWGQVPVYVEAQGFGNPGYYKSYMLSLSPSGYSSNEDEYPQWIMDSVFWHSRLTTKELFNLRDTLIPNTFAVVDSVRNDRLLDYLLRSGIGPNWYVIREFP